MHNTSVTVAKGPDTRSKPCCQQDGSSDLPTTCVSSEGGTKYSDDATLVGETPAQVDQALWPRKALDDTINNDNGKSHLRTHSDDVKLRQRALDEVLRRGRREAEAEYLRTSDASVFDPYLAPFVAGKKSSERKWAMDHLTQRWYLYDPDTEETLWCPTANSFA